MEHGLLEYAAILLSPGEVDDDVALEAVVFVGSVVSEANARLVVDAGLVESITQLMREKDDDEFVLQMRTRSKDASVRRDADALVRSTQAVFYLVDLLQDVNEAVRGTADAALDAVMDADEELPCRFAGSSLRRTTPVVDAVDRDLGVDGSIPGARDEATEGGFGGGGGIITTRRGVLGRRGRLTDARRSGAGVRYDDPARFYEEGATTKGRRIGGEYY